MRVCVVQVAVCAVRRVELLGPEQPAGRHEPLLPSGHGLTFAKPRALPT